MNVKGLNNVRVVVKTFSFAELKEKLRSAQESPTGAIVGASPGPAPPMNLHVQFEEAGSLGIQFSEKGWYVEGVVQGSQADRCEALRGIGSR